MKDKIDLEIVIGEYLFELLVKGKRVILEHKEGGAIAISLEEFSKEKMQKYVYQARLAEFPQQDC
jgi:hypothetical protein